MMFRFQPLTLPVNVITKPLYFIYIHVISKSTFGLLSGEVSGLDDFSDNSPEVI